MDMLKQIKELYLQFCVIGAAVEKIAQMTNQDLKEEGTAIYAINKWAINNKAAMQEVAAKNNIKL